ncbi:MAG: hypothetical protein ACTHW2_03735 [Tissierella sp.]|uniref:hypothetical protein n=1 Tax=Tissierella sp. TaxID=41274 RepID=UPI003F9B207E
MRRLVKKLKKYSIINNRKRILKNFYSKQIRKGKTYRASLVDRILFIIIFYILMITVLYFKTNKFILSFFMTTITSYFLLVSLYNIYKRRNIKKTNIIKEELKREKFLKELYSLSSEAFINYIKTLFEKYYDTELECGEFPIDLIFKSEDEIYKIKCFKLENEDKVTIREINPFLKEIQNTNLNNGIIVTNTFFTKEIKEFTNILTYDLENIISMSKKMDLYPKNNEIEDYIIDRFLENRDNIKDQMKVINKNRIIKIYTISIIFYIFSYAVSYKIYYKIMSLSTLIIAIVLSAYKFSEHIIMKDRSPFI